MTGRTQRRWVNEREVLGELERLSDASMEKAADYAIAAQEAAMAEATHKRERAKAALRAQVAMRANGERVSAAQADLVVEADDEISSLFLERLATAAHVDSLKESMRSIRTNQEALRTAAASARDGVVGPGWSGK